MNSLFDETNSNSNSYLYAAKNGNVDMLQLMDNEINHVGATANHAYLLASGNGRVNVLQYLDTNYKGIINVHIINKDGDNAYLIAACNGRVNVLQYLDDQGIINVHAIDKDGNNAYSLAACTGNVNVLQYLDDQGIINVHTISKDGDNAYSLAAYNGHVNVLHYLDNKGIINVHATNNKNGHNAYHLAAYNGHVDVLRYLDAQGIVNVHATATNGNNVYSLAKKHSNVINYLTSKQMKPKQQQYRCGVVEKTFQTCTIVHAMDTECYICKESAMSGQLYLTCAFNHFIHMQCHDSTMKYEFGKPTSCDLCKQPFLPNLTMFYKLQ